MNPNGRVMVARQELRVGKPHAGKTVTIVVEDAHFRVLDDETELIAHPRVSNRPIERVTAYARHAQRSAVRPPSA